MFVCNTQIMKHENICLQYMNNENMKIFAYITWIMKIFVGITSIWNTWIMKIGKYLFAINELWKNENVCLQTWIMNIFVCITWIMKIFCLKYMNYEKNKMFVRNAWIMKIFFAIHELLK